MTNVNSPRFWTTNAKTSDCLHLSFFIILIEHFIPGTVYKQNAGMFEKLPKKTLILLIIICMRYLGYILGLITRPDQTSPTLVLGHEGRLGAWPANKDSQTCGCGVRDGWACGVQMRMARHGMRDGRACGLHTKAPGMWVWHKGWAGVWPGLQTNTAGHQGLAWLMRARWQQCCGGRW